MKRLAFYEAADSLGRGCYFMKRFIFLKVDILWNGWYFTDDQSIIW